MSAPADFVINQSAVRILFGANTRSQVAAELEQLGVERVLVTTTKRGKTELEQIPLGDNIVGIFDGARQHVPEAVATEATALAKKLECDAIVAYGGGTAVGLAKAIALEHDAAIVAVPTTYSGSEMTNVYGITSPSGKRTGRDARVKPRVVIYDPELTRQLPVALAMTSGFNSMAHAVEALYANAADPITILLGRESIASLGRALPRIASAPDDVDARGEALYGAFLSASTLNNVGMALHHKLCHVLGGSYDLPHAPTHTIVLPHAISYNAVGAPEAIAQVAVALGIEGNESAARGLFELITKVGAPTALKDIGMAEGDLDEAADKAMQNAYYNPTPLDRDRIRALLDDAYFGRPPG